MANTCCNSIRICDPERSLRKIYTAASQAQKHDAGQETSDLYRMLISLGVKARKIQNIKCRENFTGGAVEYDPKERIVKIESESAWNFQYDAWETVKKKFPDVSIYYLATEGGNDLFVTNDCDHLHFKTRYMLDWSTEDGDGEFAYLNNEKAVVDYVTKNIGPKVADIQTARKAVERLNTDNGDSFGKLLEVDYDEESTLV